MIKIKAIDHIVLRTSKQESMINFYCDVLGCNVERSSSPEIGLIQLRAGNSMIDLVNVDSELGRLGGDAPSNSENNMDHFCLQINPLEENVVKEYLKSKGIAVGEFQDRYGAQGLGPSIYIKDPEGNTVELKSFKKDPSLS